MSGTARWSQPTRADSHVRSAPVAAVLEVAVEVSVLPVGSQHCGNRSSSPVRQESRLHQSAQRIGELVQQIRLLADVTLRQGTTQAIQDAAPKTPDGKFIDPRYESADRRFI